MGKSDGPRPKKGLLAGAARRARKERLRGWTLIKRLHGTPEERQRAEDVEALLLDRESRGMQSTIRAGEIAGISPIPGLDQTTQPKTTKNAIAEAVSAIAARRQSKILPLLEDKGWTTSQWAAEAGVDWHVPNDYLKGRRNPRPSSRKALAKALGLSVTELPS